MAVLLRFFASLLDILYLCDAFGDASQVKAAAQHSTSSALRSPCTSLVNVMREKRRIAGSEKANR